MNKTENKAISGSTQEPSAASVEEIQQKTDAVAATNTKNVTCTKEQKTTQHIEGMPKKKNGRPTIYTEKLADALCNRISEGESVLQICRSKNMPSQAIVYRWLSENRSNFIEKYAKAREKQAEYLFDEMLEIADDASNDWIERELKDGRIEHVYNNELVNRSRLRIDTRKWYLSKVLPKKFGEKMAVEHSGKVEFTAKDRKNRMERILDHLPEINIA